MFPWPVLFVLWTYDWREVFEIHIIDVFIGIDLYLGGERASFGC